MKNQSSITIERLRLVLHYNPSDGRWTWIAMICDRKPVGTEAGCVCKSNGYRYINVDYRRYKSADLAWFYMTEEWPSTIIDHENLEKDDDSWINLRLANRSQNGANQDRPATNTTGIKGVRLYRSGKFSAQIQVNKKQIHLGYFDKKEDAGAAYAEAARLHFGEFAR